MENDKIQEQIKAIEGYLAVNPDWRNTAWRVRVKAYLAAGDEKPWSALALYREGVGAWLAGDYIEAIRLNERAAHLDPGFPWPANNLAWVLSTCPDERLRDGKIAILYSEWSLKTPQVAVPSFISTLAAAHAAAGDFDLALRLCEKAIEIWPVEEYERMRFAFLQGNVYIDRGHPPGTEQFSSAEGCGRAKWGMSKMDVKAVFPEMVIEDNDTTRVCGLIVRGHPADAVFLFHYDLLYRAVVHIAGIGAAEASVLYFRKMKAEETGTPGGGLPVRSWGTEETRAQIRHDPQRLRAVIDLESRRITALRRVAPAGLTNTVQ
jgi:hypothetical protein